MHKISVFLMAAYIGFATQNSINAMDDDNDTVSAPKPHGSPKNHFAVMTPRSSKESFSSSLDILRLQFKAHVVSLLNERDVYVKARKKAFIKGKFFYNLNSKVIEIKTVNGLPVQKFIEDLESCPSTIGAVRRIYNRYNKQGMTLTYEVVDSAPITDNGPRVVVFD